ncbi:dihydrolipoyl dehydrogenase [Inmirania thermothiophila]|uniref:Dihydrolipoyl dehydrogenase n=1 Tax=Inmirania thermothiophila TaxID=1750597 RepID=A0A3N1Y967_9GAMM|nr:dihydrolipoyl dehydrogenase [Inmirania thermothiophila]ROR35038.1 dihydrolipoamide dehydrogenase [Inmirania thermothiophila]
MGRTVEVKVPDIGDFRDVEVIEVLVSPGDRVSPEDSLITLESDKATMEVPSPHAGVVRALRVQVGDRVSEGSPICVMEVEEGEPAAAEPPAPAEAPVQSGAAEAPVPPAPAKAAPPAPAAPVERVDLEVDLVVLGAGPGGYTAAFRAADLGLRVALVERYPRLGGVCLNVGCIPSKALLHAAAVIDEAEAMGAHGILFGRPRIDLDRLRAWKDEVVGRLTQGLAGLARRRKVQVLTGTARFVSPHALRVEGPGGVQVVGFAHAVIAAGSEAARLPGLPDDERIMDSTGALALPAIPKRLLVIGGGIIGLEMATVYRALGSAVTVVELTDGLLPGCDRDLVAPLEKRLRRRLEGVHLGTRVIGVTPRKTGLAVYLEGEGAPESLRVDRVLVAVGRIPNGHRIGAEAAGVRIDEHGFIPVDAQQRTNVGHIFAIGDIVGQPMLAHKAAHQGKVAAEVAAGHKSAFDARAIPAVAYTDPEVAWMGLTEAEARAAGIEVEKGVFPWAASGRALSLGRDDGLTKLLFDKADGRLVGAGIVGPGAGELIAETVLALEMGADAEDIGLSIHPHPTLSETVAFAAEAAAGTVTDLYLPRRR